ncbi:MAG: phospho-N-acetylmuramoyl-pentapeptide-transferase [Firmicutes bacterium]|nr:phospho-N-acetylmuramoyl-pentapeptide-transferase [Bacillota bacterium]
MNEASLFDIGLLSAVCIAAFILTPLMIKVLGAKLPRDHGREFAVAGEKSKGKIRGAGVVMMPIFAVLGIAASRFAVPDICFGVILILAMLTGYLDDRSETPWSELKKGIADLVECLLAAAVIVLFEPEAVCLRFAGSVVEVSKPLYVVLAAFFLWLMINAFNCTDGIDGLLSGLSINSMAAAVICAFLLGTQGKVLGPAAVMTAVLLGYLLLNTEPSTVLMGDAGSRPLGLFAGILFLRMGNALLAIPLCIVILLDGLLGLVKLTVLRVLKTKNFMAKLRTPLHDHLRKNKGASNAQVRYIFNLVQLIVSLIVIIDLMIAAR